VGLHEYEGVHTNMRGHVCEGGGVQGGAHKYEDAHVNRRGRACKYKRGGVR
jgi:hypothetical protein